MSRPIIVIMAAGIGSRYGGLKQIDSVGPNKELIIDYSIYDAIKAGFSKVVFIINRNIEKDFKEIIGNRISNHVDVEYAYQDITDLPNEINIPSERVKPLGTGHALYCARHAIDAPFAIINADDFYSFEAFSKMYEFLSINKDDSKSTMVGYSLKNTVTDHGYVSRGVCEIDNDSILTSIVERPKIRKEENQIVFQNESNEWVDIDSNTIVSMNMWGFMPEVMNHVESFMIDFFEEALIVNPLKSEFYLPYIVDQTITKGVMSYEVLNTSAKWFGVTYKEDKEMVVKEISKMHLNNEYPKKLWEDMSHLREVCSHFKFDSQIESIERYGDGHINDTYKLTSKNKAHYILQRINHDIFKNVDNLMSNIDKVTSYLGDIYNEFVLGDNTSEFQFDSDYEILTLINTTKDEIYYVSDKGLYFRAYVFVEGAKGYNFAINNEMLYEAGKSFGIFQKMLDDFPVNELYETLPNFHHTPFRFETFKKVLEKDVYSRASMCKDEIDFVYSSEQYMGIIIDAMEQNKIPIRVTHNDTKLNNVLLDQISAKARCVIDLDTVMPGSLLFDYGDAIRSCGSTEPEDSENINVLKVDMDKVYSFSKGLLEAIGESITDMEIELIPISAFILTFECGLRFLTDFLDGDNYFKVHKENHNLIRAKNQFKFASELLNSMDEITSIIEEICERK